MLGSSGTGMSVTQNCSSSHACQSGQSTLFPPTVHCGVPANEKFAAVSHDAIPCDELFFSPPIQMLPLPSICRPWFYAGH